MRILPVVALSIISLLATGTSGAAPVINLPQTGQTACYDVNGNKLASCTGTGQDGATLTGVRWPNPRFFDNGDGTITDYLTGLSWTQDAKAPGPAECTNSGKAMIWGEALSHIACLNSRTYLGRSDWRLPNINELLSLTNSGETSIVSWLSATGTGKPGFHNVLSDFYHSSTTGPLYGNARTDFGIFLESGIVTHTYDYSAGGQVWPVRSSGKSSIGNAKLAQTGQQKCYDPATSLEILCAGTGQDGESKAGVSLPSPRFTTDATTVTDTLTGLQWVKDGSNLTFGACGSDVKNWNDSLKLATCLNGKTFLGKTDWRVPNSTELLSLFNPAVDNVVTWLTSSGFALIPNYLYYWSSTSSLNSTIPGTAKAVNFALPGVGVFAQVDEPKSHANYLLLVRTAKNAGGAQISLAPQEFNFGKGSVGTPLTQNFIVKNTTNTTTSLTVTTTALTDDPAGLFQKTDTCNGKSLAPGAECVMAISFTTKPDTMGTVTATWHVKSNDPLTPDILATVSGMGQTPTTMKGDVNNDAVVNVFDALLTLQYAVGLYHPNPTDLAAFMVAADVAPLEAGKPKGDSVVNVFDALAILRHAVGLDPW